MMNAESNSKEAIIFVGPYSPVGSLEPHLGAARKIEMILEAMKELERPIVMVNTAHNQLVRSPLRVSSHVINGVDVSEVTPSTSDRRSLGKLKNLFEIQQTIRRVVEIATPGLVWIYNGYAFECMFAHAMRRKFRVPVVLEWEDWHFSRSRGLNPKPYLDWFAWRRLAAQVNLGFVVNEKLATKLREHMVTVKLLPGLVSRELIELRYQREPFSSSSEPVRIGYFGGLNQEKGADLLVGIAGKLPHGYELHVTGAGPLQDIIRVASEDPSCPLVFHGAVDRDLQLYILGQCDIVLNPHASVASMAEGVFPFKVIEAIASGRVLISTPVPAGGFDDLLLPVCESAPSIEAFVNNIRDARAFYHSRRAAIEQAASLAGERFGPASIVEPVRLLLESPSGKSDKTRSVCAINESLHQSSFQRSV